VTKLLVLLAFAGAVAGVVFFWRRREQSWDSMWSSAKDSTSSWSKTASHEAGKAGDRMAEATGAATTKMSDLAEQATDGASHGTDAAGRTASKVPGAVDTATSAASDLADEVKGRAAQVADEANKAAENISDLAETSRGDAEV
jgi:hypothetical protein